ncbi:MAG: phosphatidate cytidylyltransferase [Xanthomonadaceae bacterium]|nr:phosphatidate cytidylyltransferase [Xanthomonadaceae bacterium]
MTKIRVLTALVMAPAVIAAVLLLPTGWLMLLSAVVFLLALWEWLRLADLEDTLARSILLAANLGLMVALVWGSKSNVVRSLPLFQLAVVIGAAWWCCALLWLRHFDFASGSQTGARLIKLGAATLAVVPAWCALAVIHAGKPHGPQWLLLVLLLIWAADSGAYFTGRKFGGRWFNGRKLAPRISPNKTLEGMLGGIALAMVVAVGGALLLQAPLGKLPGILLVAAVTVLFSVAGDLFESLLKRHADVKDSGTLIPGHGGVLDRVDSLLAALPIFALGKVWMGF